MMREFQAENDRNQIMIENNSNVTADSVSLTSISNDELTSPPNKQQLLSDQSKINVNTSESRTITDRNKLNNKSVSRLSCDTLAVRLLSIFQRS